LLPPDPRLEKICRVVILEVGLAAGMMIGGLGLVGTLAAFWTWYAQSFGDGDPSGMLRLVVPSAVCITLGCQIIFSSFFLSILGMKKRAN